MPISLVPLSLPAQPISLNELWAKDKMTPPMANSKYIAMAVLTSEDVKGESKRALATMDMQRVLHRSDAKTEIHAFFVNTENLKSTTQVLLYDLDNHRLAAGAPQKLNISRGQNLEKIWELPLSQLPAGFYRVDLMVGDGVAWRQFFKLAD